MVDLGVRSKAVADETGPIFVAPKKFWNPMVEREIPTEDGLVIVVASWRVTPPAGLLLGRSKASIRTPPRSPFNPSRTTCDHDNRVRTLSYTVRGQEESRTYILRNRNSVNDNTESRDREIFSGNLPDERRLGEEVASEVGEMVEIRDDEFGFQVECRSDIGDERDLRGIRGQMSCEGDRGMRGLTLGNLSEPS